MSVWAIIPAKGFAEAKSRLASALDAPSRAALARRLLCRVITACREASRVDHVLVVTNRDEVVRFAEELGAVSVLDPPGAQRLAEIVDFGIAEATRLGARSALVLMGDLPLVDSARVDALVAAIGADRVAVCPDAGETHTNALGLPLGGAGLSTTFGEARSFDAHLERARRAGYDVVVVRDPRIAFDVDTVDDLERFIASSTPE